MKRQIIRIYDECEGGIERSLLVDGFFYPNLTQLTNSFFCSTLNSTFFTRLTQIPKYPEIQYYIMTHLMSMCVSSKLLIQLMNGPLRMITWVR